MTTPMGAVQTQSPPAYENRVGAFNSGHGMPTTSPGLSQDQQAMNSSGPPRVRLTGGGLGMSQSQSEATMGGMLKPQNGVANDTWANVKWQQDRQY